MSAEKLLNKIRAKLLKRDDVWLLDDADVPIFGIVRKNYEITRRVNHSAWQPYEKTTMDSIARAFAVDFLPSTGKPTKAQLESQESYESMGCLYVMADCEEQVWAMLGTEAPK